MSGLGTNTWPSPLLPALALSSRCSSACGHAHMQCHKSQGLRRAEKGQHALIAGSQVPDDKLMSAPVCRSTALDGSSPAQLPLHVGDSKSDSFQA